MQFKDIIKTDIFWIVVLGTPKELDRLESWADRHSSMYVIFGRRREHVVFDGPPMPNNVNQILARIRAKNPEAVRLQRFGFKAARDARWFFLTQS